MLHESLSPTTTNVGTESEAAENTESTPSCDAPWGSASSLNEELPRTGTAARGAAASTV